MYNTSTYGRFESGGESNRGLDALACSCHVGCWGIWQAISLEWMSLMAVGAFVMYFVMTPEFWRPLGTLGGPANWVTSLRLVGIVLIPWIMDKMCPLCITAYILGVLAIDGLDGYLARKTGTVSYFGAIYDRESDAFYVWLMSSILFWTDKAGPWVLLIGILRYLYVLTLIFVKEPEQPEVRTRRAQVIAAILMIGLGLSFIIPPPYLQLMLGMLLALVLYSFGRSFWIMINHENTPK